MALDFVVFPGRHMRHFRRISPARFGTANSACFRKNSTVFSADTFSAIVVDGPHLLLVQILASSARNRSAAYAPPISHGA